VDNGNGIILCETAREAFSTYYDGESDGDQAAQIDEHLRTCKECASAYIELKNMLDEVRTQPELTPPEGFKRSVMRRIATEKPRGIKKNQLGFRQFVYAAASFFFCFIILSAAFTAIPTLRGLNDEQYTKTRIYDTAYDEDFGYFPSPYAAAAEMQSAESQPMPVSSPAGGKSSTSSESFTQYTFNITVTVDDFAYATRQIEQLNGYSVNEQVYYADKAGYNSRNQASYTRRVDNWAYESVKHMLRMFGTVSNESESAMRLNNRIADTQARLTAKEQEMKRLTGILDKSASVDVMIAVQQRLNYVMDERDSLRGQLNGYYDTTAHPIINITLNETPPPPEIIPPATFSERVGNRFIGTVNSYARLMENLIVWLSGAALPFIVWWAVISTVTLTAIRLLTRKTRKAKKIAAALKNKSSEKGMGDGADEIH